MKKTVIGINLLVSLVSVGLADSQSYKPNSIGYVYPKYQKQKDTKIYNPQDYNDFNFLSVYGNAIHQYGDVTGYSDSNWLNGGLGLEFGRFWNFKESKHFYGVSIGMDYFGQSSHVSETTEGSFNSYSFALPVKLKYRYQTDVFAVGVNGGVAYGFGINTNSGSVKTNKLFNNILPVIGADIAYRADSSINILLGYNHYFGGWSKSNYISVGGMPSISVVSLGVSYAF